MKRSISIYVCIFIITLLVMMVIPKEIYAGGMLDNVVSGGDSFIKTGENTADQKINVTESASFVKSIYSVLVYIFIVCALIWGLVLAILFITGSVEQKAKIKERMIPYVLSIVVVSAAFTIWKFVVSTLDS